MPSSRPVGRRPAPSPAPPEGMDRLDRPIVVLGAARSGTTLTADLMASHPTLAYWIEPRYIWNFGRPLAPDDRRAASEATPRVRAYIRRRFEAYAQRLAKARFMEKTPSNCFRVPFVHAVLPDARFIHVIRDGRDVTLSAVRKWTSPPDPTAIRRRLRSFEIPLADAPFYAAAAVRDVIGRQVMPEKAFIWGPRYPGIRTVRAEQGVEVACAVQWRESVRACLDGLAHVPAEQQIEVRFERLVADPEAEMARLLAFAGLDASDAVMAHARQTADAGAADRWRERPLSDEVMEHLEPFQSALGYV